MSTILVQPVERHLTRGSGAPTLHLALVQPERGVLQLQLDGLLLWSWRAPDERGASRIPVGEHTRPDGWIVRVTELSAQGRPDGGVIAVLRQGRFLCSLELGPDGVARGETVAWPEGAGGRSPS